MYCQCTNNKQQKGVDRIHLVSYQYVNLLLNELKLMLWHSCCKINVCGYSWPFAVNNGYLL